MLGFYFDQTMCTGCKACQIACKDKHDLPVGVNWRRVAEYSGGDWMKQADGSYTQNTFAYYVSMACNHCEDAVCQKVCPTTAMTRREDGTVYVDATKCVGCRYCEWACPYSGPQFNADKGIMTKCDLCADYRAENLDPACVSACPSRALDWGPMDELKKKYPGTSSVAPLPDPTYTKPNLVVKPHRDARRVGAADGEIVNPMEI